MNRIHLLITAAAAMLAATTATPAATIFTALIAKNWMPSMNPTSTRR